MKNLKDLDKFRIDHPFWSQTKTAGAFKVMVGQRSFIVLASISTIGEDGLWEHISVSPKNQKRCPTWDEMCAIKDLFFNPDEECVEFHPKKNEYVNASEHCLHIWRPANGNLRKPAETMASLNDRDEILEKLWEEFEDVPINPETERIEEAFLDFPAGMSREDIWNWFDIRHSKGVTYLLYGDGIDRTDQFTKMAYLKQLCPDCESSSCGFNRGGVCRFPLVHERKPRINDVDGCIDYDYREGEA